MVSVSLGHRTKTARLLAAVLPLALLAGCTDADAEPGASDTTAEGLGDRPVSAPAGPNPASGTTARSCPDVETAQPEGPSAQAVIAQEGDETSPRVTLVRYPRPTSEGTPWSHWGQGLVTDDGRFVSALGNHLGEDGNSWLFSFDPGASTDPGTITRFADVLSASDAPARPSWGYGKVHAQIVQGDCHEAFVATYWGTRSGLAYSDTYRGDLLFRLDPATLDLDPLGTPVTEHGIPSMASAPQHGLVFAEAVDPLADTDGDSGAFVAINATTGDVLFRDDTTEHIGFRSILVDGDGSAYLAAPDGQLLVYEPDADVLAEHPHTLPGGGWLRAATPPTSDGSVYAATPNPEHLAALRPDGTIDDLGEAAGYTTSLAAEPDGSRLYYVPGAHGGAPELGAPVIGVDTTTGDQSTLVRLDDLTSTALGLHAAGSYSVVRDPTQPRLYVMLNAGPSPDDRWGEVVLAVVDLPDPPDSASAGSDASASGADSPVNTSSYLCTADSDATTVYQAITDGRAGPLALTEVTDKWGANEPLTGMRGHAAAAGDVDGDGWTDLLVGTFADRPADTYQERGAAGPSPDRLLLGGPDGLRLDESFPAEYGRTSGAALADLDNDGDLDMVLARNVRDTERGSAPSRVLRNDEGQFTPVTTLPEPVGARSVGVLDYDADGLLDLFITEDRFSGGSSRLLRNTGDLTFRDVTARAGLPDDAHGLGVATADLTGDGLGDLVVGGSNRVFVHQGDARFAELDGAIDPWPTYGTEDDPAGVSVADVDGDGRPDVVIGQHYNSTIDDGQRVPVRLYLNKASDDDAGAGLRLVDVTEDARLTALPTKSPHVQIADVDNDGRRDIVTTAAGRDGLPIVFVQQESRGGVPRFAASSRPGPDQYWVTGAVVDIDRDGRLDVMAVEWEPSLPTRVWGNDGEAGHWLAVSAPAGASVQLTADDQPVASGQAGTSTGYAAGPDSFVWLGLGTRTEVDVTVENPDGSSLSLHGVQADQHLALCNR